MKKTHLGELRRAVDGRGGDEERHLVRRMGLRRAPGGAVGARLRQLRQPQLRGPGAPRARLRGAERDRLLAPADRQLQAARVHPRHLVVLLLSTGNRDEC